MVEIMPPPSKSDAHGRAWRIERERYLERVHPGKVDATVEMWVIEAPWAHPVWHSYWAILMHLRPLEGVGDPKLYRPDATHELIIFALDPSKPRAATVDGRDGAYRLEPANFAAQLVEPSDEAARTRVEGAIDLIIAGELNPDTDAMRQWTALFGDAMIKPEWR
jgi:hypothetical protein